GIQNLVFEMLAQDSEAKESKTRTEKTGLSQYALVCKAWQEFFEKKIYRHLTLDISSLYDFDKFVQRQRALVKHIWLRIELATYKCPDCVSFKSHDYQADNATTRDAIIWLFYILSTWDRGESAALAWKSRRLNRLAASYIVDALQKMNVWNGTKGNACAFRYEASDDLTAVGWHGTWDLALESEVIDVWKTVARCHTGKDLTVHKNRLLDKSMIVSHAIAIRELGLSKDVIHPVSLKQIQKETERYFWK
ncbi:hypothetical protein QQX98_007325, partial [Neonectria punicea]